MKFIIRLSVFCAIAILVAQPAFAESVYTCPDISKAVQVADCPSEEELRHMFSSTCGRSQKSDPTTMELCVSFESFMEKKNSALWESGDGEYMGYVTCNKPASKIKAGKLLKISLTHKGVMDKIICSYDSGADLSLRTRMSCQIPGAKLNGIYMDLNCTDGSKNCKAICE